MDKLTSLFSSRKFWAALVGLLLIVVKSARPDFPVSEADLTNMVYMLAAYIIGTAIEAPRAANSGSAGSGQAG
jgi:hypothetical protein